MGSFPPILILAAPRTGTNLLRVLLEQDPRILNLREPLNPRLGAHHPTLQFWTTKGKDLRALDHRIDTKARAQLFRDYVADVENRYRDRIALYDLKYDQAAVIDPLGRMPDRTPASVAALLERNAAVVHLARRNPLAQYASYEFALRDDLWVAAPGIDQNYLSRRRKISLDISRLLDELRRIEVRVEIARRWLGDFPRVLNLHYEDILDVNTFSREVQRRIEALLGFTLNINSPPGTKKIAPPLSQLIQNPGEVRAALRGTPYEWCLGDVVNAGSIAPAAD